MGGAGLSLGAGTGAAGSDWTVTLRSRSNFDDDSAHQVPYSEVVYPVTDPRETPGRSPLQHLMRDVTNGEQSHGLVLGTDRISRVRQARTYCQGFIAQTLKPPPQQLQIKLIKRHGWGTTTNSCNDNTTTTKKASYKAKHAHMPSPNAELPPPPPPPPPPKKKTGNLDYCIPCWWPIHSTSQLLYMAISYIHK